MFLFLVCTLWETPKEGVWFPALPVWFLISCIYGIWVAMMDGSILSAVTPRCRFYKNSHTQNNVDKNQQYGII